MCFPCERPSRRRPAGRRFHAVTVMQDFDHRDDGRRPGSQPGAPQDAALLAAILESATDYAILTFDAGRHVTS
jgi:hypothetical protein